MVPKKIDKIEGEGGEKKNEKTIVILCLKKVKHILRLCEFKRVSRNYISKNQFSHKE